MSQEDNTVVKYKHTKPQSPNTRVFASILKISGLKNMLEKDISKDKIRNEYVSMPNSFKRKYKTECVTIDNRKVWTLKPENADNNKLILYLHGGSYVYGVKKIHWKFIEALLEMTNCTIVFPDYPLAPEFRVKDSYSFMNSLYKWIAENNDISNLIIMGDSAGAGLALGFTQYLSGNDKTLPQKLILISPWLDMNLTNPNIKSIAKDDNVLSVKGLQMSGELYAGDMCLDDYRLSPIYGNFETLPEISIFIGSHDILYADTERFYEIAQAKEYNLKYYVYPKMFHDWIIISTKLDESKYAIKQISEIILD